MTSHAVSKHYSVELSTNLRKISQLIVPGKDLKALTSSTGNVKLRKGSLAALLFSGCHVCAGELRLPPGPGPGPRRLLHPATATPSPRQQAAQGHGR